MKKHLSSTEYLDQVFAHNFDQESTKTIIWDGRIYQIIFDCRSQKRNALGSEEIGVKVGDVRIIKNMLFYASFISRPSWFRRLSYVTWRLVYPEYLMGKSA